MAENSDTILPGDQDNTKPAQADGAAPAQAPAAPAAPQGQEPTPPAPAPTGQEPGKPAEKPADGAKPAAAPPEWVKAFPAEVQADLAEYKTPQEAVAALKELKAKAAEYGNPLTKPEDVKYDLPEGMTADPGVDKFFRDAMVKGKFTPAQAKFIAEQYISMQGAAWTQRRTDTETELRGEWGMDFEKKVKAINQKVLEVDRALGQKGQFAKWVTTSGIGNEAQFGRLMYLLAYRMKEPSGLAAGEGGGSGSEAMSTEAFLKGAFDAAAGPGQGE